MSNTSADSFYLREPAIGWNPPSEGLELRDGTRIDVSSLYWRIPGPSKVTSVNLRNLQLKEGGHFNAIRMWVAHNLRYMSVPSAVNSFSRALPFFNSAAFIEAAESESEISFLVFSQGQLELEKHQLWQRHAFRDFYKWCHSQQFVDFR